MEAFLISLGTVAIAEMGDRTQLLSLMLAARYRRPWPILAGMFSATLANHAAAGALGRLFGSVLTPRVLDAVVGLTLLGMALWSLKPDRLTDEAGPAPRSSVFVTTFIAFFIAEIGDKTQIATVALAAAYPNLLLVVAGTTSGMMLADAPAVFLGKAFADRLPLRALNIGAALLFGTLGVLFVGKAILR